MIIDTDKLPDPEDIAACAKVYEALKPAIGYVYSWNNRVAKGLKREIQEREGLPIGKIGLIPKQSWEYDIRIADEMPQFGRNTIAFSLPCENDPSRVLEILLEAMPELVDEIRSEWKVTTKVDKDAVKGWLHTHKGGAISDRIRELMKRETELGILP